MKSTLSWPTVGLSCALATIVIIAALMLRPGPAPVPTTAVSGAGTPSQLPIQPRTAQAPVAQALKLDPAVEPQPLSGECRTHGMTFEQAPVSIETEASFVDSVVRGRIVAWGAAQWNTEGGKPPVRPDIDATRVVRLVQIDVTATVRGATTPTVFWVPGGVIGCHRFTIEGFPDAFKVGDEYLLFATGDVPRSGTEGAARALAIWPIENGAVVSPFEGRLPVDAAIARLQNSK